MSSLFPILSEEGGRRRAEGGPYYALRASKGKKLRGGWLCLPEVGFQVGH